MRTTIKLSTLLLSSLLASTAAFAGDTGSSGKSTPAQIFNIDGVYYGCIPGSQAKGVALGKCTKLPSNLVDYIKANGSTVPALSTSSSSSTTATTTTTKPSTTTGTTTGSTTSTSTGTTATPTDDDSADTTVVGTPQGPKSCPVTAFTSDKQLDLSQCEDAPKGKKVHAVCRPATTDSTASTPPATTTGSTTSTTASTTTTTSAANIGTSTLLTCAMPGETQSKNPLPKFGTACPGGGSHEVTGGYDASTGKIDITITFTACIDERGVTHDGTAIMQGTLSADSSNTNLYQLDETKTINSTLSFPAGGSMTRACTVVRKGAYNNSTGDFTGTVSRNNCSMTGAYRFKKGLVDNLIENAAEAEPI